MRAITLEQLHQAIGGEPLRAGTPAQSVEAVCTDMHQPYLNAVGAVLKRAETWDQSVSG